MSMPRIGEIWKSKKHGYLIEIVDVSLVRVKYICCPLRCIMERLTCWMCESSHSMKHVEFMQHFEPFLENDDCTKLDQIAYPD